MMLRIHRYVLAFSWCLCACGHTGDPKPVPADSAPAIQKPQLDSISGIPEKDSVPANNSGTADSIIVLEAKGNRDTLHADIQKDYQQVHIQVPVAGTRNLAVQLNPEGRERNVRISQIEMPDGKTDGPFGRTMQYKTLKKGVYTLIIARSNMADGIVKGPVGITIQKD
ncbi:hypothetical protein LQ567_24650 [Niabella pedocola]|uniref:Uncharacterized protein n=1 Tax=Niabella pedocola TaxID=1752077 RepID=A0ABS8PY50_9BACT|nr:hypothetical protein [Niabella pedocola]MCD2425997.1 hypothetical protein [Niabella pedocola]